MNLSITQTNSTILNLIRCLCSQGVVLGHLNAFFNFENGFFNSIASYCVLLFFVLSGFLISFSLMSNVEKRQEYKFKDFFKDRFFRIYPPFIATLILVFLLDFVACRYNGEPFSTSDYIKNFTLNGFQLQEYPVATFMNKVLGIDFFYFPYMGTNLPLWTIAIEWWLYMFYGFTLFYIFKKRTVTLKNVILFCVLGISPVYYLFVDSHMGKGITLFWYAGTIITLCMRSVRGVIQNGFVVSCIFLLLLLGMYGFLWFGFNGGAMLFFFALLLLMVFNVKENNFINGIISRPANLLASYSYSLYLIHYTLLSFVLKVFVVEHTLLNAAVLFLVVNIFAFLFAHIFETKKIREIYENYRPSLNRF